MTMVLAFQKNKIEGLIAQNRQTNISLNSAFGCCLFIYAGCSKNL